MVKKNEADILNGMKAICDYVGRSEATVLKWVREYSFPAKKVAKPGQKGPWVGSKSSIDSWTREFVTAG